MNFRAVAFAVTFKILCDLQDTDGRKGKCSVNLQMHPTACITMLIIAFLTDPISVNTELRLDNLHTLSAQPSRCDRGRFASVRLCETVVIFLNFFLENATLRNKRKTSLKRQ